MKLQDKIDIMLKEIRIDKEGNWIIPNRNRFNLSIAEFAEFERQRLLEFNNEEIKRTKYKYHYESEVDNVSNSIKE